MAAPEKRGGDMPGFDVSLHRFRRVAVCAVLATALGACAYHQPGPRAQIGALTGAAAGGLIGSATSGGKAEAIVAGVLLAETSRTWAGAGE